MCITRLFLPLGLVAAMLGVFHHQPITALRLPNGVPRYASFTISTYAQAQIQHTSPEMISSRMGQIWFLHNMLKILKLRSMNLGESCTV
jgi:hypothetical protein